MAEHRSAVIIAKQGSASSRAARRDAQDASRAAKIISKMTDRATTLLVVRHGETEWNVERRLQGQSPVDPPLNELGEHQAEALAHHFSRETLHAVYSSDLRRAAQTAQAIASRSGLQVTQLPQLRERHAGVLHGLTYDTAPVEQPAAWRALRSGCLATRLPGGGESCDDVLERVVKAVNNIAAAHPGQGALVFCTARRGGRPRRPRCVADPGQRVLLVLHGGVIHAVYRHVMGRGAGEGIGNGAVGVLKVEAGKWVITSWNDASHVSNVGFMKGAFGGGEGGA